MADTGRYGRFWQAWPILAGIAVTGRYVRYWHVWRILAGMAGTAGTAIYISPPLP